MTVYPSHRLRLGRVYTNSDTLTNKQETISGDFIKMTLFYIPKVHWNVKNVTTYYELVILQYGLTESCSIIHLLCFIEYLE